MLRPFWWRTHGRRNCRNKTAFSVQSCWQLMISVVQFTERAHNLRTGRGAIFRRVLHERCAHHSQSDYRAPRRTNDFFRGRTGTSSQSSQWNDFWTSWPEKGQMHINSSNGNQSRESALWRSEKFHGFHFSRIHSVWISSARQSLFLQKTIMRSLSRSSCLFVRINVLFQFTLFSFRVCTERLLTVIANMNLTSNDLLRF